MSQQKEYGDFQTPASLAERTVAVVEKLFGRPDVVIEPTAGLGAFPKAAAARWTRLRVCEGYEINGSYVQEANESLGGHGIRIHHRDFFSEDGKTNLARFAEDRVLVLGNPPWVTNSDLGQLGSANLPEKSNFQRLRGLDARTGKSNFDIAEWMLIRLMEALPQSGAIAMLCKTMTARKVLRHFWKAEGGREETHLFHIDAKSEFGVSVDACLFYTTGRKTGEQIATVHSDFTLDSETSRFGFADGDLVSDLDNYRAHKHLDGGSSHYTWRSGLKHDAAKIMELHPSGEILHNGLGEEVDIEGDYLFPLLKSSDLGNGRVAIRKFVLVTQRHPGEETARIRSNAPKTWDYLIRHASALDGRASSIYASRPRFSVFGIGSYSFAPWKIAVSGLYKRLSFVAVPPHEGCPVMVDDTCYSIPCQSGEEAGFLIELLSSQPATRFLNSLIFADSKRPITIDVLRRLSIVELAREMGELDRFRKFAEAGQGQREEPSQLSLLMEPTGEIRIKSRRR
jgi:hypothetical protein